MSIGATIKQCQPISVRERSKLCQDQRERSAISGLVCAITIGWDATRLADLPVEWSRQHQALGLPAQ